MNDFQIGSTLKEEVEIKSKHRQKMQNTVEKFQFLNKKQENLNENQKVQLFKKDINYLDKIMKKQLVKAHFEQKFDMEKFNENQRKKEKFLKKNLHTKNSSCMSKNTKTTLNTEEDENTIFDIFRKNKNKLREFFEPKLQNKSQETLNDDEIFKIFKNKVNITTTSKIKKKNFSISQKK